MENGSECGEEASSQASKWLLHWLVRLLVGVAFVGGVAAIAYGWPLEKTGTAYQLLGLLIAALGVPIVDPALGQFEVAFQRARRHALKLARERRQRLRLWWARIRKRPNVVDLEGTMSGRSSLHGDLTVTRLQVDRDTVGDREWLGFLNDEIVAIWDRVRGLEQARTEDLAKFDRQFDALAEELHEEALAITREGWHYILGGAGMSALGIGMTLVA